MLKETRWHQLECSNSGKTLPLTCSQRCNEQVLKNDPTIPILPYASISTCENVWCTYVPLDLLDTTGSLDVFEPKGSHQHLVVFCKQPQQRTCFVKLTHASTLLLCPYLVQSSLPSTGTRTGQYRSPETLTYIQFCYSEWLQSHKMQVQTSFTESRGGTRQGSKTEIATDSCPW